MKLIDLTGQRFGRWLVVEKADQPDKDGQSIWKCLCDCGAVGLIRGNPLRKGKSQSCGCLAAEMARGRARLAPNAETHGCTKGRIQTAEYRIWSGMIKRCTNEKCKAYKNYGGRGIRVCERWLKFENFLADMGERPEGKTLDRYPNNDGNYEPGNCRWATPKEQNNNRRDNMFVHHNGAHKTLQQLADEFDINPATLRSRLVSGLPLEAALTVKPKRGNRRSNFLEKS